MNDKQKEALREMVEIATLAADKNPASFGTAVASATLAFKKAVRRAEAEAELIQLTQDYGPTIEFHGREVYADEHEDKAGRTIAIELYETVGGRLVVVNERTDENGRMVTRVRDFECGDYVGVMDELNWQQIARNMAKKLGWSTVRLVD